MTTTIKEYYTRNPLLTILGIGVIVFFIGWIIVRLMQGKPLLPNATDAARYQMSSSGLRSVSPTAGMACTTAFNTPGQYDVNGICQPTATTAPSTITRYIPIYIVRERNRNWGIPRNQTEAQRIADAICALNTRIARIEGVSFSDSQALAALLDDTSLPSGTTETQKQSWLNELRAIRDRLLRLLDEGGWMISNTPTPCRAVRKLMEEPEEVVIQPDPIIDPVVPPVTPPVVPPVPEAPAIPGNGNGNGQAARSMGGHH